MTFTTSDAAAELAGLPLEATVAMADVVASMRDGLLAFATSAGLVVTRQTLEAELAGIVGSRRQARQDAGSGRKRWIATGLIEAQRSFRRVRGHNDMQKSGRATQ